MQLGEQGIIWLVLNARLDPEDVSVGDKGSAVVALSRPVNGLAVLRHQVEERVEFDAELYRPRRTGLLKLSLLGGYSSIRTWSTPLPSGAS
jgi:hypothetical protein